MNQFKINTFALCMALLLVFSGLVSGSGTETPAGFISRKNLVFRSTGAVDESALRAGLPDSIENASVLKVLDSLQSRLHVTLGYYRSRIEHSRWVPPGRAVEVYPRLEVWIERGEPTGFGRVGFTGLGRAEEAMLRRWIALAPGSVASDKAVKKVLQRVVEFFVDRGHPYCAARILEVGTDSASRLKLLVKVDKGRPVSLGEIKLSGAAHTRAEVVKSSSGLRRGSPTVRRKFARHGNGFCAPGFSPRRRNRLSPAPPTLTG